MAVNHFNEDSSSCIVVYYVLYYVIKLICGYKLRNKINDCNFWL